MDTDRINTLSYQIIGCAYTVINTLGVGFLEKVYENALAHEIRKHGLCCDQQYAIDVRYDQIVVGHYVADLLIEKTILVELKTVTLLDNIHMAQCINYLKATGLPLCLLINFNRPKLEIERFVSTPGLDRRPRENPGRPRR